jgi:hypothetical protein
MPKLEALYLFDIAPHHDNVTDAVQQIKCFCCKATK